MTLPDEFIPKCVCGRDCKKAPPGRNSQMVTLNYGYYKTCGRKKCVADSRGNHCVPKKIGTKYHRKSFKGGLSVLSQKTCSPTCYICGGEKPEGKQVCEKCHRKAIIRKKYIHKNSIKAGVGIKKLKEEWHKRQQQEASDFFDQLAQDAKQQLESGGQYKPEWAK